MWFYACNILTITIAYNQVKTLLLWWNEELIFMGTYQLNNIKHKYSPGSIICEKNIIIIIFKLGYVVMYLNV